MPCSSSLFPDLHQGLFRDGKNEVLRRDWESKKKKAFQEWDKDGNNGLDLGEVETAVRRLIPQNMMQKEEYDSFIATETKKIFEAVDIDKCVLLGPPS